MIGALLGMAVSLRLAAAAADPSPALATGPITTAAGLGDAGVVRRAEPRTEVALTLRPALVYDEPGYYGMLDAALELQASWAFTERAELFGSLAAAQLRYVQNGTLSATNVTLGGATLGATYVASGAPASGFAMGGFLRLHLPTSREYGDAVPLGVEPGLTLRGQLARGVSWYGGAAVPILATPATGGAHPRVAFSAVGGGAWSPWAWFSAVLEATGRFGPLDALDTFAAGLGLRFATGHVGLELDGVVPLAGASRYTAAAVMRAAWRFDARER